MRRMCLNGACRSGSATCERRPSSVKITNFKSITVARKINSAKPYDRNRLMGGADVPRETEPEAEDEPKTEPRPETEARIEPQTEPQTEPKIEPEIEPETEAEVQPEAKPETKVQSSSLDLPPAALAEDAEQPEAQARVFEKNGSLPTSGPCCSCIAQTPGLVGDKKVDEILEYVHQNIDEAVKALSNLSENFEHDLKLVFVDILGRIQQWSGIVQNKLHSCRNEVNNLGKEVLARTCEVANLKAQMADYQSKEAMRVSEPSRRRKEGQDKVYAVDTVKEDAVRDIKQGRVEYEVVAEEEVSEGPERKLTKEELERRGEEEKREGRESREEDERRGTVEKEGGTKSRSDVQAATSVQTVRDKIKYESELETEIERLRKENDRMTKERAEYESAIQRALLRGVSSLNVEALRVLRCPPIPCCAPCVPCPPTMIVPPEPTVVPCPARSTKRRSEAATMVNSKALNDRYRNGNYAYSTTKRSCCNPGCSAVSANGRKQQNGDSNMFLLLRQGDTEVLRGPDKNTVTTCDSSIIRNFESPRFDM